MRRQVEGPAEKFKPRGPRLGLKCEFPGRPFRGAPEEGEGYGAHGHNLAPENLGREMGRHRAAQLPPQGAVSAGEAAG